jgi:MHS family proline/betaine transporter-like MFS transporter
LHRRSQFLAVTIGANFFPAEDPLASLLSTFLTIAVGFIMRPIGALLIGAYGDKFGRKAALILSFNTMAIATGLTGLLPTFEMIGIAAPILLILCRSIQGLATGGEFGGAATFLVEYAPERKRGLYGSWQQCSVGVALLTASFLGAGLNIALSKEQLLEWGWRIPFLLGALLGPVGYYLRSRVDESPVFERLSINGGIAKRPIKLTLSTLWKQMLLLVGITSFAVVANYLFLVFLPVFAINNLGIPASGALLATSSAFLMFSVLPPFFGLLSDKVGRKPVIFSSAMLMLILCIPLMNFLLSSRSITSLFIVELSIGFVLSIFVGPMIATLCELFPSYLRYTALSISYGCCQMIFGGFSPVVSAYLIRVTGNPIVIGWIGVSVSLLAVLTIPLIKDMSREDLP